VPLHDVNNTTKISINKITNSLKSVSVHTNSAMLSTPKFVQFLNPSLASVILLTLLIPIHADSLVISSLATARSFIYKSGDPLYLNANQSDIWRICPTLLNPKNCYPDFVATGDCAVITPDCRCYTWGVQQSASILAIDNCVYIQIPQPNQLNFSITWTLDYTYPVLPPGYISYQKILYRDLISRSLSYNDFATITAPLFCEAAKRQSILLPEFDRCQYTFDLNISYIPGATLNFNPPARVGPIVLAAITTLALLTYTLIFLRHPRNVKLDP
jgi:hypothetical protein